MQTGDIVLIPFPFSELTDIKIRPAVVISETKDKYKDLILAAVSSQMSEKISVAEIILGPDSLNGLRVKSVIKVDRIFTLKANKVITSLGRLNTNQIANFKLIFKSLVD